MITRIEIENFKSFKRVSLSLGHLNLFVGANASGKSNFLDALRVLQAIGNGYLIHEILSGKPQGSTNEVWKGVRGGKTWAGFRPAGEDGALNQPIKFQVRKRSERGSTLDYQISFRPLSGAIHEECLIKSGKMLFEAGPSGDGMVVRYNPTPTVPTPLALQPSSPIKISLEQNLQPILHQLIQHDEVNIRDRILMREFAKTLSDVQHFEPVPDLLKAYADLGPIKRIGDHGENFAALVESIIKDEKTKAAYLSWLQALIPAELEDVTVMHGALNEPLFAIKEREIVLPAPVLSEGTLRFAALAALFFQKDMPEALIFEEIETGIHAGKLQVLLELMKAQAKECQIFATTHSNYLLSWLKKEDYLSTFFCKRDEETGESIIKPLSDIPHFVEVAQKHPVDELFAEGWLEGAL